MKYFLTIATLDGYRRLNLNSINKDLEKNNNLRELCAFTMFYNTYEELKYFLFQRGIITLEELDCAISIGYYSNSSLTLLELPLAYDKTYFNVSYLSDYLSSQKCDEVLFQDFLSKLISLFPYLPESFYQLRSAFKNQKYDELYSFVVNFLTDLCYKNGKLNYLALYKVAMIVSNFKDEERSFATNGMPYYSENQLFHLEQLVDRSGNPNEQMYFDRLYQKYEEQEQREMERIVKT